MAGEVIHYKDVLTRKSLSWLMQSAASPPGQFFFLQWLRVLPFGTSNAATKYKIKNQVTSTNKRAGLLHAHSITCVRFAFSSELTQMVPQMITMKEKDSEAKCG
jgi:hypothetical protein